MKLKDVMMRAKCGVLGALFATGLTAVAVEPDVVQLWEGGPYWATSNLGEPETWYADHPEYGALYTFDETDTAVKSLLGVEWRVPSWDDFKDLINRCNWAWSGAGFTFTGKGDYASHSIFFPAAGWDTGGGRRSVEYSGLYWSSTKENSSYAYYLVGDRGGPGAYDSFRSHRMAVRAVRDALPTVTVDSVTPGEQWCKITVNYTVSGTIKARDYAVVFEVTAGGRTASVTTSPGKLTDGAATKVVDTEKLFGRQIYDENAKIKVSLMKLVGARQLWEGGPYWAECNYNAIQPCDYGERLVPADANNRVSAPWRVPSRRDFEALANNCNREKLICTNSEGLDVVGCRFTGRGDFSSNSIFMPAGGCQYEVSEPINVGSIGYYCTCECDWIPWRLSYYFAIYMADMGAECRGIDAPYKMTVRAVRDTPPLVPVDTDEKEFGLVGLMPHIIPLEYVDADGTLRSRSVGEYELLTDNTATIRDGRWYAVTGTVSRGTITVNGSANIVLCDGARLMVTDRNEAPGVSVSKGSSLTIYGQVLGSGELVAHGGTACAGIGGGDHGDGGTITINGGIVTAQGGERGAGIGGGNRSSGGTVTINGGTVTATCGKGASGIGGGKDGAGGAITINGGNVVASSLGTAPKNGAGKPLHKVTLNASDEVAPVFGGLDGYGLRGVVPVDGKYCFYLPDGSYQVSVGTATGPHGYYFFIVNGQDVVCNLQQLGLTVNGEDVGVKIGDGWTYGDNILQLNGSVDQYVLSGISTFDEVQVQAASDCTVDLSDAIIYTQARPAFVVDNDVTATLRMKGGVSHLAATNAVGGASVSAIEVNGTLNVDFAPDADQTQSAIYAFNFGDQPAIGGSGEVSLIGGHLCAWSDNLAVSSNCTFQIDASSRGMMLGQVGDSWDDVRLVGDGYYLSESNFYKYSKLEVAPAYRVIIPASIDHVGRVTISNSWQKLLHDSVGVSGALTNRYYAILDDTIVINCEVEGGYVMVGANPQIIPFLTNDVVVLPDVRTPLTITLPETLEGETYVVMEDGVEVNGEGEGASVYPVRSGYDIKIVCTAQEGWRIVSETNVVTFANIQESRVLTAADLPQAWRVFTVNVPAMANVAHELSTDDARMTIVADWETSSYAIISNAEVTVAFRGVGNYRVTANGTKTWTLTGDVVFGTADGFPLPAVEGIPGTIVAPWSVGENIHAYTNIEGVLTITGTGEMDDFANAADVPWDPAAVRSIAIGNEVTKIGVNTWFGMSGDVVVDGGLPLSRYAFVGEGFAASEEPSGSISPAEFERVDIVDGVALLGVSVYTSDAITNQNWSVATNGVIEVPAPGKQGFFILQSKPSAPSDAPHSPITILE